MKDQPGNIVCIEWKLPVEAPQHAETILIIHQGVVYAGVFTPPLWPQPPHAEPKVIRYPEDLSPVRWSECDYWADLPTPPYR